MTSFWSHDNKRSIQVFVFCMSTHAARSCSAVTAPPSGQLTHCGLEASAWSVCSFSPPSTSMVQQTMRLGANDLKPWTSTITTWKEPFLSQGSQSSRSARSTRVKQAQLDLKTFSLSSQRFLLELNKSSWPNLTLLPEAGYYKVLGRRGIMQHLYHKYYKSHSALSVFFQMFIKERHCVVFIRLPVQKGHW